MNASLWLTSPSGAVLGVVLAAALAWGPLRWPELPVAAAAVLALLWLDVLQPARLIALPGSELLWLMAGAGVLGAVLQAQGVVQRVAALALRGRPGFSALCWRLTVLVGATAWLLPSTSARAALCLPLFDGLATHLPQGGQRRALALLLPTTILLSAGGSLLGAGAHLIAIDSLRAQGLPAPSYLGWLVWAAPFAVISCALATAVLLRLFTEPAQRHARLQVGTWDAGPWSPVQRRLLGVVGITVLLWAVGPVWGLGPAPVAVGAALLVAWPRVGATDVRVALRGLDLRLLAFLATGLLLADAVVDSGAASAWAQAMAGPARRLGGVGLLAMVITVSLLLHVLIGSRSARVAVLLPVLVLPLALALPGGGAVSAPVLVMAAVLGTGFCQTLAVSSKPMLLFARHPASGLAPSDLLRLSACLLPLLWLLLMGFGLWVWPALPLPSIPPFPP
ncbi:SLC13 family permease [Hydrogenophaga sp.]|uniref:SLC13 family permease n=1 Tax=Hydrogenophaga sp. TaxID=1904254 RepID=UPI002606FA5A|nr:SLC13 family permease [Hydrogenophaga sp.]